MSPLGAVHEDIQYEQRIPTPEEHRRLAEAVGWSHAFNWDATPESLRRSLAGVVAIKGEEVVGMGRLVGDGVMYFYVQDVAVDPAWQGRGIGQAIIASLVDQIRAMAPGGAFTGLFATLDALPLYRRNGFTEGDMTGMFQIVE